MRGTGDPHTASAGRNIRLRNLSPFVVLERASGKKQAQSPVPGSVSFNR